MSVSLSYARGMEETEICSWIRKLGDGDPMFSTPCFQPHEVVWFQPRGGLHYRLDAVAAGVNYHDDIVRTAFSLVFIGIYNL